MAVGISGAESFSYVSPSFLSSQPKVFVTGGLGQLGRALIVSLKQKGLIVQSIGRTNAEQSALIALGCDSVGYGEVSSVSALINAARGSTFFVHCASSYAPRDSTWVPNPTDIESSIIDKDGEACATHSVLEACRALTIHKLIVVTGFAVVCGGSGVLPITDAIEDAPLKDIPHGARSAALRAAERAALKHCDDEDPPMVSVVRPALLWGGHGDAFVTALVSAARRKCLRLVGGGKFRISTCHVQNACAGITAALRAATHGAIYFVTDGAPLMYVTFVRRLLLAASIDTPTVDIVLSRSVPLAIARRIALLAEWFAHFTGVPPTITEPGVCRLGRQLTVRDTRARISLGYRNAVSFEQGMQLVRTSIFPQT